MRPARLRPAIPAAALLLLACVPPPAAHAAEGAPPVPVRVAESVEKQVAPTAWVPGTVVSRNDARIAAEVEGRLTWVAEVGTRVESGEPVARIDDVTYRLLLAEAEALVARERARLVFFRQEVDRLETLRNKNNVAKNQFEQALADRDAKRSEVRAGEARVAQAREDVERTVIRAPFAGVVTERVSQTGERVDLGEVAVRLVDIGSLEVRASVQLGSIPHLKRGAEVEFRSGENTGTGRVRTLVPVGDDLSRTFDLRLDLLDGTWSAGQTVRVAVPTDAARQAVVVPRDALVLRRDATTVFRVTDDGVAERIEVVTGVAAGDYIEIRNALAAGDRVVVRGNERLRSGQKVTVLDSSAAR